MKNGGWFSPSFRSSTSERSSPPKLRFTAQDHRGSSASQTTAFRSATSERGPKEAFDGAVARSPIEPGKGRVVHAAKVRGSSAGESVGDASGTGALVVVDLTGRTLQVSRDGRAVADGGAPRLPPTRSASWCERKKRGRFTMRRIPAARAVISIGANVSARRKRGCRGNVIPAFYHEMRGDCVLVTRFVTRLWFSA